MRQKQLSKLRALFISLGGLSADLANSTNLLDAYAAENIKEAHKRLSKKGQKSMLKVKQRMHNGIDYYKGKEAIKARAKTAHKEVRKNERG